MISSVGPKFRELRTAWGFSLKEVEERSIRLAKELDDPAYIISASWLARIEKEEHELTTAKLRSLVEIFNISYEQILGTPRSRAVDLSITSQVDAPNLTVCLQQEHSAVPAIPLPLNPTADGAAPELTTSHPSDGRRVDSCRRFILGRLDRSLNPMIRAGSILEVDTQKRAIAVRKGLTHEFDRPIYLLMSHAGYSCGWCELDTNCFWLTLVPHPLSHASSQRWRFKKEVEIVGRVVAVHMRLHTDQ